MYTLILPHSTRSSLFLFTYKLKFISHVLGKGKEMTWNSYRLAAGLLQMYVLAFS